MNKYVVQVAAVILVFFALCLFTIAGHAEEPVEIPAELETVEETPPPESSVQVYDPALYERLDDMQTVLEDISASLAEGGKTDEQAVAPDYSGQLDKIESTLSKIQKSAEMATAETAEPAALEKPFEDYTTVETLALIGLVLFIVVLFVWFIRQF